MELIGVPFDLCGKQLGSRLGPQALRLAGIARELHALGFNVSDVGDLPVHDWRDEWGGLAGFEPALDCVLRVKNSVLDAMAAERLPLVMGGDHFISVGSVSAALEQYGSDLALLWIDAHADINTPSSSQTGNLHGMPVAALLGLPSGVSGGVHHQWNRLLTTIVPETRVLPHRIGWFGLRDADEGDRKWLCSIGAGYVATMHDIDRRGLVPGIEGIQKWLQECGAKHVWISFDVDALDPVLAPGTGTTVRGGLSYREMHLLAELLSEYLAPESCATKLVGLDVVEVNPIIDSNNSTAIAAVEWVASLFGKTILSVEPCR
jgi:arginase